MRLLLAPSIAMRFLCVWCNNFSLLYLLPYPRLSSRSPQASRQRFKLGLAGAPRCVSGSSRAPRGAPRTYACSSHTAALPHTPSTRLAPCPPPPRPLPRVATCAQFGCASPPCHVSVHTAPSELRPASPRGVSSLRSGGSTAAWMGGARRHVPPALAAMGLIGSARPPTCASGRRGRG